MNSLIVVIMANTLADTLADKNRGLPPSMATFWHPIVRHHSHRIIGDILANILADKSQVNTGFMSFIMTAKIVSL